jgi:nitrite reductase/ring-hydroxylating ferredoxin subunit
MIDNSNVLDKTFDIDSDGYRKLARVRDIPPGTMKQVLLDREEWEVAIANVGGKFYAFRDVCPHQAFPLTIGKLKGCKVICTAHHWEFDIESGKATCPPVRKSLETYPVRIIGNDVWVKVRIW